MPRYGVPLIATILRRHGYDVTLFVEEIHPIDWDIMESADMIGIHALACNVGRLGEIVERVRRKSRAPIIVGGTHGTYFPESVLKYGDYVVRQEGDETIVDLLDALSTGRNPATVAGVTFHRDGATVATPDRPPASRFDTVVELDTIYGWEEFARKTDGPVPIMALQTTRGCPYGCRFCPVTAMFGRGYRKRSPESVIADLRDKLRYGRNIMVVDNLFDADPDHTADLLRLIMKEGLKASLNVFCRSSIRERPDLLKLMRRAGVRTIILGVESLNQESLDGADKGQCVEEVEEAVAAIQKHGISVLASLIMGFDSDTTESLGETRRLLQKWEISQLTIFALWGSYPHQGHRMIPIERVIFKDWSYLNGNFVTHFPLRMKPSTLQREIIRTYDEVLSHDHSARDDAQGRFRSAETRRFFWKSWQFIRPEMIEYISYLEEVERGYYTANQELQTEKLKDRPDLQFIIETAR
jgi:radical SAM superfamily enzyme YgiQ (UPF0313 family)